MHRILIPFLLLILTALCTGCNRAIDIFGGEPPAIQLDSDDAYYESKVGALCLISPVYTNTDPTTTYAWTVDDEPGVASTAPQFSRRWTAPGTYWLTLTVTNQNGSATEQLRVDVLPLLPPVISFPITDNCLTLKVGTEYLLTPTIGNCTPADSLSLEWTLNGNVVGHTTSCLVKADRVGHYSLSLKATNADGTATATVDVQVVETLPFELAFPAHSVFDSSTDRFTLPGRPVYLRPVMANLQGDSYIWTVDGVTVPCSTDTFVFTPQSPGRHIVSVLVDGHAAASVTVTAVNATETSLRRPAGPSSRADWVKVFEWCPAPGQFIGDTASGMDESITTLAAANAWAQSRLDKEWFVSLGAWGGYIVVGFDHSVPCTEGFDFAITSNAILNPSSPGGGSNEPGIVYVMQDTNGNGLPDDEWYELRGSETGVATTVQNYAATYYRPAGASMPVQWTDNLGASGTVDHVAFFHPQPYYWPAWIPASSYTLRGVRLQARTQQDSSGNWDNSVFDWGYADNLGNDVLESTEQGAPRNGFKIANAVYPDLTPVKLKYIDFVKVQTGINSKAGWLGEVSTEVLGFKDLSL